LPPDLLIELAYETCEIGVLEMSRQYTLCELVILNKSGTHSTRTTYIQDDETISCITPSYDMFIRSILQHSKHGQSK